MTPDMWQVPHPRWGKPDSVVGVFLGALKGSRTWYGFEIRVGGTEQGVIFFPEADLNKMKYKDLGVYHHVKANDDANRT